MYDDNRPLEVLTREGITLPTRDLFELNGIPHYLQHFASALEDTTLGIRPDIRVEGWTYRPGIRHHIHENKTGYVRIYHAPNSKPQNETRNHVVIVLPQGGENTTV